MKHIKVRGAKQHNLKNIDLEIPKNKLVVISDECYERLVFDKKFVSVEKLNQDNNILNTLASGKKIDFKVFFKNKKGS